MKRVSIVIPAHNEEECVAELLGRIKTAVRGLRYHFEIIVVDDGSADRTFAVVKKIARSDKTVKAIKLSRNMGHQAALDCGLQHASGDAVVSMDADLQHPPELLPEIIQRWEAGADIVTTQKLENGHTGFVYKLWAALFYSAFNRFSQIRITPNASDFRLLSRKSLNALLQMPEYYKFFRGMVPFLGFQTANIPFPVPPRFAGRRKYTFQRSFKLASDGLFSFSDFALKLPFIFGGIFLIVIFIYLLFSLYRFIFLHDEPVHGWTSVIIILVMSLGIHWIFIGILGVYVGKIFFEVKRRPNFFVDETVGFKTPRGRRKN